MTSRTAAMWVTVSIAAGVSAGCASSSGVCRGVRVGSQIEPELTLSGAITRVGRFEPPGRYDICAAYGAPASVRHEAGGREAWSYGPGTFVFNYKGIIRRFHGRHPAGTVTFVDGHVVAVEFGRHPSPAP